MKIESRAGKDRKGEELVHEAYQEENRFVDISATIPPSQEYITAVMTIKVDTVFQNGHLFVFDERPA